MVNSLTLWKFSGCRRDVAEIPSVSQAAVACYQDSSHTSLAWFEPMAAPTDALRRGAYRVAEPGTAPTAVFAIRVAP